MGYAGDRRQGARPVPRSTVSEFLTRWERRASGCDLSTNFTEVMRVNEWNRREVARLVVLYAAAGRISGDEAVTLERLVEDGEFETVLTALLGNTEH